MNYRPKEKPVPPGYMDAFARLAGKRSPAQVSIIQQLRNDT